MTRRRIFFHLFTCVASTLLLFANEYYNTADRRLGIYAGLVSSHLQSQELFCDTLLNHAALLFNFLPENTSENRFEVRKDFTERCAEKDVSFILFRNAKQVFWTNNTVVPKEESYSGSVESSFDSLSSGFFEVMRRSVSIPNQDSLVAIFMIPVKHHYNLNGSIYLNNSFGASNIIPSAIRPLSDSGEVPILKRNGKPLCYFSTSLTFSDSNLDWATFVCFLLFFLSWAVFIHHIAAVLAREYGVLAGGGFLLFCLVVFRFLTFKYHVLDQLNRLLVFKQLLSVETMTPTIGDFVLNMGLLMWFLLFSVLRIKDFNYQTLSVYWRILLGISFNLTMIVAYLTALHVLEGVALLAFEADVDLVSIFSADIRLVAILFGVVILMLCLYLSSSALSRQVSLLGLNSTQKFITFLVPLGISALVVLNYNMPLGADINLLFMVFLLIPDLYQVSHKTPVVYTLGLLILFSGVSASTMVVCTEKLDVELRAEYAKKLAQTADKHAEAQLERFSWMLQHDEKVKQHLKSLVLKVAGIPALEAYIRRVYNADPYLYQHYKLRYQIIDQVGTPIGGDSPNTFNNWNELFDTSELGVTQYCDSTSSCVYLKTIPFVSPSDTQWVSASRINCVLTRREREYTRVYNELSNNVPFRGLKHLRKYKYAITQKGQLIETNSDETRSEVSPKILKKKGASCFIVDHNKAYSTYQSAEGRMAFVWQKDSKFDTGLTIVRISSIIFTLLFLILCLLIFINTHKIILPDYMMYRLSMHWPMRWIFQVAIMCLGFLTLVVTGIITVMVFQAPINRIQNELVSIHLRDLDNDTFSTLIINAQSDPIELNTLKRSLEKWSEVHQIDINLFAQTGELLATSDSAFFQQGIITQRISPHILNNRVDKSTVLFEQIGELKYRAAYKPITIAGSKTIVGYVQIPYYASLREETEQYSTIFATLLSAFILLMLFFSSFFTTWLSGYVAKPISQIVKKIQSYKLYQDSYQPIEIKRQDEFGELLFEYNKLIHELNGKIQEVVKIQREEAWRDMARQVAHEIRNPLTPMKLSIQYLQQFYNRENGEETIRRVSTTLLEQIETLSRITTEFLHFGKMPTANNETIVINEVLTSVFELFREHSDVQFDHELTEEKLYIFADRTQLVSALNNVVKNAIQSIAPGRRGHIEIALFKRDRTAVIEVKDNGIGIPDEIKKRIFEPSFTTKATGTGLGMAITSNIIQSFNGTITFTSEVDRGTTFVIIIPISREEIGV